MSKKNQKPKVKSKPPTESVRVASDPESYLKLKPVWTFKDFDWDGPWGFAACSFRIEHLRQHIEQHLGSYETMTWEEILKAAGGRKNGNNSHPIEKDKFKKEAQERLDVKQIFADTIFSLRLDAGTRIYGVREGNCLRLVFFDPHHKDKSKCAYDFDK